jgi:TolB-like protein/Tfp pilus assembly protein PilF
MTPNLEPDLKLEIAHVLTIDVVAYSTLLIDEQSRLMGELVRSVKATPRFREASAADNLISLPTGDGMALVFLNEAEAPIECAMQIAASLKEHPEIRLRMGIHSGPVNTITDVNDRINLAGTGIDTAQRVMDCGDAGHILVSKRVADDLAAYPRWNRYLHDLGECEVKHGRKVSLVNFYDETFGNPALPEKLRSVSGHKPHWQRLAGKRVIVFVGAGLLLGLVALLALWFIRSPAPNQSIAVLPFVDSNPVHDREYFSDGIAEQIINSLARIPELFVVSRTSSFAFRDRQQDIRDIARRLHVSHVLEGSVTANLNRCQVDAQLVDARNGYQVWAESYDSTEKDLLTLQNEIAQKVAAALRIKLGVGQSKRLAEHPTNDPEAYDLYLRGRYLLNKRTTEGIQSGLSLFQRAVGRDPQFALGHAGTADAYILLGEYGAIPVKEVAVKAWPEVESALKINNRLPEAYVSRAMLFGDFEWKWDAAEADYRKAIELNPNSAPAHHWFALQLAQVGRNEEALQEIAVAQKHDPLSPIIRAAKAKILLVGRRFREAAAQCQKILELEPNFAPAYSVVAQAYAFQGEYAQALSAVKKYVDLSGGGDQEILELAYIQALAGREQDAQRIVSTVEKNGSNFSPYDRAAICVASRDFEGARRWLEVAINQHSIDVEWARVDPRLDSARAQSEFGELLSRLSPR